MRSDQLISQLSTLVAIRTNNEANGAVDVFTATGQALVVNNTSTALGTVANNFDPTRLDITKETPETLAQATVRQKAAKVIHVKEKHRICMETGS